MENKCYSHICVPGLGLGFGIASGLAMMLFAWASWQWGIGASMIDQYSAIYKGYSATLVGGAIGGLWGLAEGFIFGIIVGWVYNCCARCCRCGTTCPSCNCNTKK